MIGRSEKNQSKVKYQVISVTQIILKKARLFFWYLIDSTSLKINITTAASHAYTHKR